MSLSEASIDAALASARVDRQATWARIAARPRPFLVGTFGGFQIEAPPSGEGGRRLVQVVLDMGPVTASTHDTALAGKDDIDDARLRRETGATWGFVAAYLARDGLAVRATVDGREAGVEVLRGGLGIRARTANA